MVAEIDSLYIRTRPLKALDRLLSHFFFQGRFLTTNYRWLNILTISGLQLIKHFPQVKPVEKPIFIIGTGRSGSTILGKVLSIHKDIGLLNEPKAIWYCIDPRDDVNGHFHLGGAQYYFTETDATPSKCLAAKRLFSFYLDFVNSKRIVDKNPEIVYRIHFVQSIFPDAKFIFLVRNGWDTVFSIAAWSRNNRKTSKGHTEDWWGLDRRKWDLMLDQLVPEEPLLVEHTSEIRSFTRQEDMAAVEWIIAMQQGLRDMGDFPNSIYVLQYENLTLNPRTELIKLANFCELSNDDLFFSYAQKVIFPYQSKPLVEISPVIHKAFISTVAALDYPTNLH